MAKWNRKDKSKSAFGKINQANAIIDTLKNTTIDGLIESLNTLNINYGLLYEGMQELSNLATSNTQQIQSINQLITTLNQKVEVLENK